MLNRSTLCCNEKEQTMNTATMPNLGLAPDILQRAAAVLRGVGWSAADLFRLALIRTAVEGRIPFDDAAQQEAKDAKAEAALANWEAFMKEPPIDVDFRALCPPSSLNERVESFLEGWQ